MINQAQWIWLNPIKYPNVQKSTTWFSKDYHDYSCRFAEFQKEYHFEKQIEKVVIQISADVKYFLYVNGRYVGVGPVTPGGDYNSAVSMPQQYYSTYEIAVNDIHVRLYALIQTLPIVQCDMTQGQNGFICACKICFVDGSVQTVYSDESWLCRLATEFSECNVIDLNQAKHAWENAVLLSPVWNLYPSEILNTVEESVSPIGSKKLTVSAQQTISAHYELDKIYSGYYAFSVQADGAYEIRIYDYEKDANKREKRFVVKGTESGSFRSVVLTSAGSFDIEVQNLGKNEVTITDIVFLFQHYPCLSLGEFECNDEELNKIYNMGKHALKICRQSIELDSPKHQENLQCAGDYHIASLMNYYADGDTALTRFDIMRIARYLEISDGYMFHTTYGLIWVQMVYQYYLHSGDKDVLHFVKPALGKLLKTHAATVNDMSLINSPLNYMFVDWIDVDGYTMHHPPKALGQTVLNAFYYEALKTAAFLYATIGENSLSEDCLRQAEQLKSSFSIFFDSDKGLYFDGLSDLDNGNQWTPPNTEKRYYSWHSNTLAVLYGLAPKEQSRTIIEKMLNTDGLISPQPYFMHFVLEAIHKVGLFEQYGMKQLNRWKYMTEFEKGLVEGWVDCEAYPYDYSHVWAGTPTYQLPQKLSGLKIIKAGFEEISLNPQLFGLEWAKIKIPTQKGVISIEMRQGKKARIDVPKGIKYTIL